MLHKRMNYWTPLAPWAEGRRLRKQRAEGGEGKTAVLKEELRAATAALGCPSADADLPPPAPLSGEHPGTTQRRHKIENQTWNL